MLLDPFLNTLSHTEIQTLKIIVAYVGRAFEILEKEKWKVSKI